MPCTVDSLLAVKVALPTSILLVFALFAAACGDDDETVRVFAAASLTDAFEEIAELYEAQRGVAVDVSFAGSSALREQILDGAPVDVFASANVAVMAAVEDAGRLDGPPLAFASNELVLAAPVGNPGGVQGLTDLERDELIVGVCAAGVPCGDLAAALFEREGIEASIDTEEPNVKALLAKLVLLLKLPQPMACKRWGWGLMCPRLSSCRMRLPEVVKHYSSASPPCRAGRCKRAPRRLPRPTPSRPHCAAALAPMSRGTAYPVPAPVAPAMVICCR